jgi:hypothetical protein
MANRSKDITDTHIEAEMSQGARSAEGAPAAKTRLVDRLLNGAAPSDTLYLTNQTFGQKAWRFLFMASPVLLLSAAGLLVITLLVPKSTNATRPIASSQLRAKVLPGFDRHFKLDSNRDLEVTGVHFEHTGGTTMVGNIHNKSGRRISLAVVVFELADPSNFALGAVTVTELDLAPGAGRTFKKPIEQTNAMSALVREVDTR